MVCQVEKLEHYRHILLFEFNRGGNPVGIPVAMGLFIDFIFYLNFDCCA